jgi:GNAT superfamily N-acetyltransferase
MRDTAPCVHVTHRYPRPVLQSAPSPTSLGSETNYVVTGWQSEDCWPIYQRLERTNWAPWLAYSPDHLERLWRVFPDGHLVVRDVDGRVLAYLSANRIEWDGDAATLPTWDEVAGGSVLLPDYDVRYARTGNTMVLLSLSVSQELQGTGLPGRLIREAQVVARRLGLEHLIGSFRPTQYGRYKLRFSDPGFEAYCAMRRADGQPLDAWLRVLARRGMQSLRVARRAMKVRVSRQAFEEYRQVHNPGDWMEILPGRWECGEAGAWRVPSGSDTAMYVEDNLWGALPS